MTLSLTIRRIGVTLALAVLISGFVGFFSEQVAALVFVPSWIGLFFCWPRLSRKLDFKFPKTPGPRPKRSTAWGRVIVTGVISYVIAYGIALLPGSGALALAGPLIWITLYRSWPMLSRQLPLSEAWRARLVDTASSNQNRTPLRRFGRGMLATMGVITVFILLPAMFVAPPILGSEHRAQRVRDSIRIGMTVPEVLDASRDCDIFQAGSDFPYDEKSDGDNIPAMGLSWNKRSYVTYDLATGQNLHLTEAEAVERLHLKLHDGYRWRFSYTYINITPMHISFSVNFGPDERVSEVTPVHGWD